MNQPKVKLSDIKLSQIAVSESGFIFDPTTGNSFNANETGVLILKGISQGQDESQIVDALMEKFEVSEDEAHHDLHSFVSELHRLHLGV